MPNKQSGLQLAARFEHFLHSEEKGAFFHFQPAYFFSEPEKEIYCNLPAEMPAFFDAIDQALGSGYFLAGYLSYELGQAFEPSVSLPKLFNKPLGYFGVYRKPISLRSQLVTKVLKNVAGANTIHPTYWLQPSRADFSWTHYQKKIAAIKRYIAAGDTYQVNLTFPLLSRFIGNAGALFADLFQCQPVGYAGLLRHQAQTILSLSPELFFERLGKSIKVRPMKGTAPRGKKPERDQLLALRLSRSKKNRAENLMIVDLLRNDLGRICQNKSVQVEKLFDVEAYQTLFQMTSTISGQLQSAVSWQSLFSAMFPSGSVTGAPKIRTMQIIRELESRPRGVYTGALGYITPTQKAVFNIPIRTVTIDAKQDLCLGIGSGIVSDSNPASEWREAHLKAAFFKGLEKKYHLLETMRWESSTGFRDLSLHLKRLKLSAAYFKISCQTKLITEMLKKYMNKVKSPVPHRVRLLLDVDGRVTLEKYRLDALNDMGLVSVGFSLRSMHSKNIFLQHKTTHREHYNQALLEAREKGLVDVLFFNEHGHVTEGAITNIFIRKKGHWFTPPLQDGLLPGIERAKVLKNTKMAVREKSLTRQDLLNADAIFLSNSVRGFFQAQLKSR